MRRFGIELEWVGDTSRVLEALREAGVPVQDRRHTHAGYSETAWTVKRDGSVGNGGELVSPPLDFDNEEHRAQVTTAVTALQAAGARPDSTAGIHVHIEALNFDGTPLTGRQIASVVRFFHKFEDAIYRIASSGWRSIRSGARTYAKRIPTQTAEAIMKVHTIEELERVWDGRQARVARRANLYGSRVGQHHDRYYGLNLRSYFSRNTIEFRVFNSSCNPKRVQAYIALCMAIVDDARHGYSRSVKKSYKLGDMASGRASEKSVLLRLQQILTCDTPDSTAVMSKADWKLIRFCWKDSVPQQANVLR